MTATVTVIGVRQSPIPQRQALEVARITGNASEYQLSFVEGVERTPEDETIVSAPMEQALFVFDRNGRYKRSIGRAGKGPGEFTFPSPLGLIGDTLWVGDPVLRRISLFTLRGRLLRTIPVLSDGQPWLLAGGDMLLVPGANLSGPMPADHHIVIERVAAKGEGRSVILDAPAPYRVLQMNLGGTTIFGPQQFDDGPRWAVAPDGSGIVYAAQQPTGASALRVRRVDLAGRTIFDVRIPFTPLQVNRAVTDAEVARMTGRLQVQFSAMPDATLRDAVRRAVFVPRFAPTITRLVAVRGGYTWIRREAAASGLERWTVLDASGKVAYDVHLPAGAEVKWARGDRVLAILTNSDDVPDVVEYRIR